MPSSNRQNFSILPDAINAALKNIVGLTPFNKFGHNLNNVDTGVFSDIWAGAETPTPALQIMQHPTSAQIHNILSTSINDTALGSNARTLIISGLTSWTEKEVTETITLNGLTPVPTVNSYVFINRMEVLENGGAMNAGIITATASISATVSNIIQIGEGQTQSTHLAVPSVQRLLVSQWQVGINNRTAASVFGRLMHNGTPQNGNLAFKIKDNTTANSQGTTSPLKTNNPFAEYSTPCIIKIQGDASANNSDVTGNIDGYLVDK